MGLSAGTQLGPYEVIDLLGAGAMGEVYRARDTRLRRQVALKVLPPQISDDPVRLRRFEQEARAAGALNHPNIVAIHDVGHQEGAPYVVSELLEGETLRERLGGAPLPPRKAVEYGVQIARGLAAAHEKGVVHRDLKPDNIFITRDGGVKILDFGLARVDRPFDDEATSEAGARALTGSGTVLGTVGYMSPEQVRGEAADHRSDVFSFGAVLYEMLTGKRAFKGRSAIETMNSILREDPPPLTQTNPGLPPALERVVDHCLEKSPAERFQSARDLAFDLEALTNTSGSTPRVVVTAEAAWKRLRPAAAAAAIVALPAAGFLLARATAHHPNPEYQRLTFRRGTVYSARLAPDGQVVYSAAWDGRAPEVYARRPETPEARPLGIRNARVVGVSPSGELALLLDGDHDKPTVLARASINGGPPREVLEHVLWADWAPNGSDFAVVRHESGRYRLEYPVGHVLQAAPAANFFTHPRVSPDGERVAYLEHPIPGDDRGAVAVVDRSGRKTILSSGWASTEGIAWSPDGSEVFFTATPVGADAALFAVDLGGRRRLVEKAPGRLVLYDSTPDGRLLLERSSARVEMRGERAGQPPQDLSWFDYSSPIDLTADGEKVLFVESGEGGGPGYSVYLRPTTGELPVRLGGGRGAGPTPHPTWVLPRT
jgi:tRNA A-37 threonylcarbamoyl transferase component Bud32